MSASNFRVVETEKGFAIFQVYYDTLGKPCRKDAEPVFGQYSSSSCGLLDYIESIQLAFEKGTLKENEIE